MADNNKMRKSTKKATRAGKFSWYDINWAKANAQVKQQQIEIAVAYKEGDKVTEQQQKQVGSFARKAIAVQTVTTNKGKKTPGVDNIIQMTPAEKEVVKRLHSDSTYVAKPVRVYMKWETTTLGNPYHV